MQIPHPSGGNLDAISAAGALVRAKVGSGVTLANGTTYYFMLGGADAPLEHVQIKWDAAIILTAVQVETCAFPRKLGVGSDSDDVTDVDETEGNWVKENPPTAYVALDGTGGAGGASVVAMTVAVAGGSAGAASFHLGNLGSGRARLKVVVAGTGGLVRVGCNGKS